MPHHYYRVVGTLLATQRYQPNTPLTSAPHDTLPVDLVIAAPNPEQAIADAAWRAAGDYPTYIWESTPLVQLAVVPSVHHSAAAPLATFVVDTRGASVTIRRAIDEQGIDVPDTCLRSLITALEEAQRQREARLDKLEAQRG